MGLALSIYFVTEWDGSMECWDENVPIKDERAMDTWDDVSNMISID